MQTITILVVEDQLPDQAPIIEALTKHLKLPSDSILLARNPRQALELAYLNPPQIAILDIDFGHGWSNGFVLSSELRNRDPDIYLIFESKYDDAPHEVTSYKIYNGDMYLPKPIKPVVLAAIIEKYIREHTKTVYSYHDLIVDTSKGYVVRQGHEIPLSPKERDLLVVLIQHAEKPVSRQRLVELVWQGIDGEDGYDSFVKNVTNKLDKLLVRLGKKLGAPEIIQNVPGSGYMIDKVIRFPKANKK